MSARLDNVVALDTRRHPTALQPGFRPDDTRALPGDSVPDDQSKPAQQQNHIDTSTAPAFREAAPSQLRDADQALDMVQRTKTLILQTGSAALDHINVERLAILSVLD